MTKNLIALFLLVMRVKSAQFEKNVEHASAEAKLAKKYCNPTRHTQSLLRSRTKYFT